MIADVVRSLAVRNLPGDVALVQIDRGDASVGRLDDRETLDAQAASAALTRGIERRSVATPAASAAACRRGAHGSHDPKALAGASLDVIHIGDLRIAGRKQAQDC